MWILMARGSAFSPLDELLYVQSHSPSHILNFRYKIIFHFFFKRIFFNFSILLGKKLSFFKIFKEFFGYKIVFSKWWKNFILFCINLQSFLLIRKEREKKKSFCKKMIFFSEKRKIFGVNEWIVDDLENVEKRWVEGNGNGIWEDFDDYCSTTEIRTRTFHQLDERNADPSSVSTMGTATCNSDAPVQNKATCGE